VGPRLDAELSGAGTVAGGFDREGCLRDWFAEHAPGSPVYGWATELLVHLAEEEPEVAWDLIQGLIERAPADEALGWVAAGPLEDLLCHNGPAWIGRVEALARSDPRFKACLAGVPGSGRMDPDVYERVRLAVAGGRPATESP